MNPLRFPNLLLPVLLSLGSCAPHSTPEAAAQDRGRSDAPSGSMPRMEVRKKPRVLGPHAPRIGEWVADLEFRDTEGQSGRLSDVMEANGLILVMRDPDCPLSKKYTPRIKRLGKEAAQRGFGVLLVNPFDLATAEQDIRKYGLEGRYAVDEDGAIVQALAAHTTTEVFVVDGGWTLAYRGMIDDQYGLGFTRNAPDREYLAEAMTAIERGRRVEIPATEGQGCLLNVEIAPVRSSEVTYYERVSRIVQNRCVRCHRPGTAAPFKLTSYSDLSKRPEMIRFVVESGTMPPWSAVGEGGPWRNDARLTEAERRDLLHWLKNGMPKGDPETEPLPIEYPQGWTIEPDLIVDIPPNEVAAEGALDYIYRYAQASNGEERYIKAVEILPGAPEVVHHILFWNESPEYFEGWQNQDPSTAGKFEILERYIAMMVPGQEATLFPKHFGRPLPPNASLKVQFHYTPNGRTVTDATKIGFEFVDAKPTRYVESNVSADFRFEIPPHAKNHPVTGEFRFPHDGDVLSLLPHGHLRAKAFRVWHVTPDGTETLLLDIPEYDFNWQLSYEYLRPLAVSKGDVLRATGWYDNSSDNPNNPAPDEAVRFGRQTTQEMMVIFFQWSPRY